MARPVRKRIIAQYPDNWSLSPEEVSGKDVVLTLEEYETVRLIDYLSLTQAECAEKMDIARTTVTAIYESARKKISLALIEGRRLLISGGSYTFSDRKDDHIRKGKNTMRIAVTYENGEVFQHFGHTEQFKLYDIENGEIVKEEVVSTNGQGHGALATFLDACQVDALVCGGIGMGARYALEEAGIYLYPGVSGSADEAVKALVRGELYYDPDAHCDHHDHHEGDCEHHGDYERHCH